VDGEVPKAAGSRGGGTLGGEGKMKGLTSSVDSSIDGPIAECIHPLD
jgi:hypothetical protein